MVLMGRMIVELLIPMDKLNSQKARPTTWNGLFTSYCNRVKKRARQNYAGVASAKRRFTSSQLMRLKKAAM